MAHLLQSSQAGQRHVLGVAEVHRVVVVLGRRPVAGQHGVPGVDPDGGGHRPGGRLGRQGQLGGSVEAVVWRTRGLRLVFIRPVGDKVRTRKKLELN